MVKRLMWVLLLLALLGAASCAAPGPYRQDNRGRSYHAYPRGYPDYYFNNLPSGF